MLRLAEPPPHPDLLRSPSQSIRAFTPVFAGFGVNALMASGEKELAEFVAAHNLLRNVTNNQAEARYRW
jgi:hypothetical protein